MRKVIWVTNVTLNKVMERATVARSQYLINISEAYSYRVAGLRDLLVMSEDTKDQIAEDLEARVDWEHVNR